MTAFVLPSVNNDNLISALAAKKEEINSQISSLKAQIMRLTGGLSHIDATINLLSGADNIKAAKAKPNRIFKPSECKTAILDTLRKSGSKMDTKSIAIAVAKTKSIDSTPSFQNAIVGCLRTLEGRNLVKVVGKEGTMYLWEIV
ncbi:hypothetical protein [Wolinella succinogenes]|uniref:hypothetical protein n=1 Tax=Wolinella succinogenes TaxID=844 RepID=UPI00240A6395|nr:hypothetical protein [Wolinella succinogenes]